MVLLKGLNYDVSSQQSTTLTGKVFGGATKIFVENTDGFVANDFIVLNPDSENCEIRKISSVLGNTITLTTGLVFNYETGMKIYKTPYDQMKFYYCATVNGTYIVIAASTTTMTYDQVFTNYEYVLGTTALYYKRTFYNSHSLTESDIALSDYFQVTEETTYISPTQLRIYLQFSPDDIKDPDMHELIKLAEDRMSLDISSSNSVILKIASFLLSKHYVLNALASKAVSKGYITATVEGRTIIKAHTELKKDAQTAIDEYKVFVNSNIRSEVSKTDFMTDTSLVDPEIRQAMIDTMTGLSNAINNNNSVRYGYSVDQRRR